MNQIVYFPSEKNELMAKQLRDLLDSKKFKLNEDDDYLFIVGGDGSFIHFSKEYAFKKKKIIGIKNGSISFLSSNLDSLLSSELTFSDFYVLKLKSGQQEFYAVNEVYVSGDSMMRVDMYINESYFQRYKGSGLLFSTIMGSTAQNKSEGGPILFPSLNAWIISAMGINDNNNYRTIRNSIVISENEKIRIVNFGSWRIYLDGKFIDVLLSELEISYVKSNSSVLSFSTIDYLSKLKEVFVYEK